MRAEEPLTQEHLQALERAMLIDMRTGDLAAATAALSGIPPTQRTQINYEHLRGLWVQHLDRGLPVDVQVLDGVADVWGPQGLTGPSRLVMRWADGREWSGGLTPNPTSMASVGVSITAAPTTLERIELAARVAEANQTWLLIDSEDWRPSVIKTAFWNYVGQVPQLKIHPRAITAMCPLDISVIETPKRYQRAMAILRRVQSIVQQDRQIAAPSVGIWRCRPDGSAADWIGCPLGGTTADWNSMLTGGPFAKAGALATIRRGLDAFVTARANGNHRAWRSLVGGDKATQAAIERVLDHLLGPPGEAAGGAAPPGLPPILAEGEDLDDAKRPVRAEFTAATQWGVSVIKDQAWAWWLPIQQDDAPGRALVPRDHVLVLRRRNGGWIIQGTIDAAAAQAAPTAAKPRP